MTVQDVGEKAVVDGRASRVATRREAYIRRALAAIVPRPAQNVYRLARDFGLQEDTVRGWHCLVLLRRGHDVLAEEAMAQVRCMLKCKMHPTWLLLLDYLSTLTCPYKFLRQRCSLGGVIRGVPGVLARR